MERFWLILLSVGLGICPVWADVKVASKSQSTKPNPTPMTDADEPPAKGESTSSTVKSAPTDSKPTESKPVESKPEISQEKTKTTRLNSNIEITKVHVVLNDTGYRSGRNPALEFERKYWNYGAVSQADLEEKRGHIFVFSWENQGPVADLEARFEYRQKGSHGEVRTLTVAHPKTEGGVRSIFQVVGRAYREWGPVASWRFSIWNGDKLVGEQKSFVW